ncbi:hypothetical protein ASE73_02670 [Sphingomonas sp. Leaf24]|uniref:hypothetical protein n=1 Tax=unclassified Sphingomonas TaxID=196159 RepID=UPI0006F3FBF7|nr:MULTISPECIES: hypothetical protein [unclassified Sphingomonas]KQM23147.1 hypothetical protein ASE50_02670 [Sphingomonas sp. Leaf5]KQM96005.1 hypothetical protein ASE73_02670 [Sphingomonas sp. Leaf24]
MVERIPTMRGFSAAVGMSVGDLPGLPAGGIAVGMTGDGTERILALALRHRDGTVLTTYLPDAMLGRLGELIDRLNEEAGPYITVAG